MSSPQPTPTRPIVTRTRTGCWTCRARRKKCDETRPSCTACRSLNLACEGYGVRLKWAMRRRPGISFRRASLRKPKEEDPICKDEPQNTPVAWPISLGDCESEKDQVLLQYLGWDVYSSLSSFEKEILYDFADWGALTLFAKPATESVPDPGRFRESLTYCSQSKLMLLNSLTYQITSDPKHAEHVEEYYYRSIRAFREALSDPVCFNEGMTPYAGVLLCSISMNRAMPFSIHLRGIASIFHHQRHALQSPGDTDESRELAGLIGVLDLPTHSLGRQNGHLRLWNQHCMGQKGVEEITGLPCSLIDLFASYMDDGVEERLLKWPGEPSEPVMCKIWEATQHAGIIRVRDLRSEQGLHVHEDVMSTASALRHVLDLLRDLRLRLDVGVFASTETLLFPLVVVGSQASLLTAEDRTLVTDGIAALANQTKTTGSLPYYDAVLRVLETLWAGNSTESLDRVTREMGLELGLF